MDKITTSIITIGDELLIGQTIDTNSAWIAQQLNAMGIWVHRRVAIGDIREDILDTMAREAAVSDIVLITGGLGPTADDITKPTLCEYFNTHLVQDQGALENVLHIFESRGLPLLQRNLDQSMVPASCTVIRNRRGTAPGMWFEKEGKIYVSMPGVPHEMQGIMEHDVLPMLGEHFKTPAVVHQTLITSGMGESFIAERLVAFEAKLPPHVKLAYLPSYSLLKLRLTAFGLDKVSVAAEVSTLFHELKALLADITVADQDITIGEVLGQLLKERGQSVGTAESCTGGLIAHWITSVPGSSAYFKGSAVVYANEMKVKLLGVKPATLQVHGAVSEAVVREMVTGALALLQTDYAIAVSGIMGPDGGTPEKPVGTVWIAVAAADGRVVTVKHQLRYDRERNTQMTAVYALNELRKLILQKG
ncbi:CinA family nicotinamide mononucleotide deamidase-related protein [Chitinophaga polysaccharea]|uniref:CinA family nicotinamide mononucleotide deamidase-related protein n=1 Tax=Chitinophaga TaxID=79328 RepID=UPI0014550105|nr:MULTISPECIES: CinA family nicotinamide mononucleotide deamidase-related protein [Chitinophaga]NLR57292.1 CinA family nicotinamide mononucleotide deamidase-related protein [Chitinophaga polysaccharea]NLU91590.1 CinA family nicotinamide mononucleotide deamidase-related protein [Chitinophaga sp. Ak27]